jgi:hypothetical protein
MTWPQRSQTWPKSTRLVAPRMGEVPLRPKEPKPPMFIFSDLTPRVTAGMVLAQSCLDRKLCSHCEPHEGDRKPFTTSLEDRA